MKEFLIFEVIAPYPSSFYEVGQRFKVSKNTGMAYITIINDDTEKYDVREFPNLFKEVKL